MRVTSFFLSLFIMCLMSGCADNETTTEPVVAEPAAEAPQPLTGAEWLAENAMKEGVVVTGSGLQYRILASGDGLSPGPTDTVIAHYQGTLIDGTVFDSSVRRGVPLELPVNKVISGWTEALQMMKEGDKWMLYIPAELGYGSRAVGQIPADSVLIFEIELLEVKEDSN